MTKTFTQNDVLLYVYGELNTKKHKDIEKEILCNNEMSDLFYEVCTLKDLIKKVEKEPSKKAIDNILNYSKSLTLQTV